MRIQRIFSKFNLRTITAATCISLVSSCAYDAYPPSSYGGGGPHSPYGNGSSYGNSRTVSDPTIPLILGASAIGAIAYYGKKNHDRRHRSNHYSHRDHYNHRSDNHYNHRRNNHYNHRNHNVHHDSRNNHTSSYHRNNHTINTSHNNYNRTPVHRNTRNDYRNSARKALERKRNSQRSRPQTSRSDRLKVVSTGGSRSNRVTRSRVSTKPLR